MWLPLLAPKTYVYISKSQVGSLAGFFFFYNFTKIKQNPKKEKNEKEDWTIEYDSQGLTSLMQGMYPAGLVILRYW